MTVATPGAGEIQWALPAAAAEPDSLKTRIDVYHDSIILRLYQKGSTITRLVSADDLAHAINSELTLETGLLPDGALWWTANHLRDSVAIWRDPAIWKVALQTEPFQPPERLTIPMPCLIFVCTPARPPAIYAARHRPTSNRDTLYHAPVYITFQNGATCPGTHQYPHDVSQIPESFFTSFFSKTGHDMNRSQRHPQDLAALWRELDGQESYPYHDLVSIGTVAEVMKMHKAMR